MYASLPVGFSTPTLTYAVLSEQNPSYCRYIGITEKDLKELRLISQLLYERSLSVHQANTAHSKIANSNTISNTIHNGDRMILKGYNARYQQPVIYTNAHIEGYWKESQSLSVCVEPKQICVSLQDEKQAISLLDKIGCVEISCVAIGEYWVEVEPGRVSYCGIGKRLFLYQGENSPARHPCGSSLFDNHLLISCWVSVFEYENREKIF